MKEIETAVRSLPPDQLATFRDWFAEFDARQWDLNLEADAAAGRLDRLAEKALNELDQGRTNSL